METRITHSTTMAAELLKKGELVAIPTETVYGLAGLFGVDKAHRAIYRVKNRPLDNPLIVHIGELSWIKNLLEGDSPFLESLIEHFLPGPLTIIMRKAPHIKDNFVADLPTIAVRMPSHPIALEILQKVGQPLVAPSANLSGKPSPTSAQDVYEDLKDQIPLIVDGGKCQLGIESTVISLIQKTPQILRPGSISKEEIERVLGISLGQFEEKQVLSPGMKYRHYAPKTPIYLFDDPKQVMVESNSWILSYEGELPHSVSFSSHSLYQRFREADRLKLSKIYIYLSEKLSYQPALMNRIQKAAQPA